MLIHSCLLFLKTIRTRKREEDMNYGLLNVFRVNGNHFVKTMTYLESHLFRATCVITPELMKGDLPRKRVQEIHMSARKKSNVLACGMRHLVL